MKHHKWICTPGKVVVTRFTTETPGVGCGAMLWQMLEDVIQGGPGQFYPFKGMSDSETWVWERV